MRFRESTFYAVTVLVFAVALGLLGCGAAGRLVLPGAAHYREKWSASGIRDYRMRVVIQKTGHATPMGTYEVRIRGGRIESVLAAGSPMGGTIPEPERPLPEEYINTRFARYGTVERFFDHIEAAEKGSPDLMETEYHPTLGYPTYIHLDPSRSTSDDELMVKVLELEPIGP